MTYRVGFGTLTAIINLNNQVKWKVIKVFQTALTKKGGGHWEEFIHRIWWILSTNHVPAMNNTDYRHSSDLTNKVKWGIH